MSAGRKSVRVTLEPIHNVEAALSQDSGDIDQHFVRVVDTLAERFVGVHDRETVARVVNESRAQLEADARVTNYLPVLTSRRAIDQLAGRGATPVTS